MSDWTVLPPWLYQNDLPDDELQAVYVQQAETKWRQCVEERRDAEAALAEARAIEVRAERFLADARVALEQYRRQAPPPPELPPVRRRARPRPGSGRG